MTAGPTRNTTLKKSSAESENGRKYQRKVTHSSSTSKVNIVQPNPEWWDATATAPSANRYRDGSQQKSINNVNLYNLAHSPYMANAKPRRNSQLNNGKLSVSQTQPQKHKEDAYVNES